MPLTSTMSQIPLEQRLQAEAGLLQALRQGMSAELKRQGLADVELPALEQARFHLSQDPYDRSETLHGEWRGPQGQKLGCLLVHGNGQAFAEFDVIRPHPTSQRWFVEAVTAWGQTGVIKSELRLLPLS